MFPKWIERDYSVSEIRNMGVRSRIFAPEDRTMMGVDGT